MNISDKIKAIARIKGIPLKELCLKINMSESGFYTAIQKDRFKNTTLEKIAVVFGMSVDKLKNYDVNAEYPLDKSREEILINKAVLYRELTNEIENLEKKLFELRLKRDTIYIDLL